MCGNSSQTSTLSVSHSANSVAPRLSAFTNHFSRGRWRWYSWYARVHPAQQGGFSSGIQLSRSEFVIACLSVVQRKLEYILFRNIASSERCAISGRSFNKQSSTKWIRNRRVFATRGGEKCHPMCCTSFKRSRFDKRLGPLEAIEFQKLENKGSAAFLFCEVWRRCTLDLSWHRVGGGKQGILEPCY